MLQVLCHAMIRNILIQEVQHTHQQMRGRNTVCLNFSLVILQLTSYHILRLLQLIKIDYAHIADHSNFKNKSVFKHGIRNSQIAQYFTVYMKWKD